MTKASSKKKKKKRGRSLPKGYAKAEIVPVRFTKEVLDEMIAAARVKKITISDFVRGAVQAALQGENLK
jgi:hypothetical protein